MRKRNSKHTYIWERERGKGKGGERREEKRSVLGPLALKEL